MRRLLLTVAALAAALTVATAAQAAERTLYLQNTSTALATAELADALPALQAAIDDDFAPEWGSRAKLVITNAVPAGAWSVDFVDYPDCWFCAGYHEVRAGTPHAVVGVDGDPTYDWPITASHEIFELLADPYTDRGMLISRRRGAKPRWYALEVCDPVEADALAYTRPSASGKPVHISDFVTEAWFRRGSAGPWDFTAQTRRPLQILPQGYQLLWDGWAWTSLTRPRLRSTRSLAAE
jgi:hypothetical protein